MKKSWVMMALTVFTVIAFTAAGPQEKALGHNIRIVYLHGAWVWTALVVLLAAGLAGLGGLVSRRERLHCWSRVLGRTGMFFWITYLPISLWAMQSNWNGLFLAEPRWRLAFVFAVSGLLLQTGLALAERQALTSAANLGFVATLLIALRSTENVMHPPSPILSSEAVQIQFYFVGLLLLTLFAAWQIARLLIRMEKHCA